MFLLFGIFVAVIVAALFLILTSSVLVPILVLYPGFWGNRRKFCKHLKEELYNWKELLDVKNSFLFTVNSLLFIVNHHQKEILNQQAHFPQCVILSKKYAIWTCRFCNIHKVEYSHDWVVVVNLCNHDSLCLYFYLGW